MPNDTRGSILATYGVMSDVLLRGQMADLFDGGTNFVPEVTFEGGIVVLDLSTKIYGPARQAGSHASRLGHADHIGGTMPEDSRSRA